MQKNSFYNYKTKKKKKKYSSSDKFQPHNSSTTSFPNKVHTCKQHLASPEIKDKFRIKDK